MRSLVEQRLHGLIESRQRLMNEILRTEGAISVLETLLREADQPTGLTWGSESFPQTITSTYEPTKES
jgi:hypothetical protein